MKHVSDMIPALSKVFDDLNAGTIKPAAGAQLNNAVGKMIAVVRMQIDYARQRNENPSIPFMDKMPEDPGSQPTVQ